MTKTYIFGLLITLIICSCQSKVSKGNDSPIKEPQGTYFVQTLNGQSVSDRSITLIFEASKGQVSGSGSCNQYSATYTVSKQNIKFSQVISTKKMCPGSAEVEQNFFTSLAEVNKVKLEGATLELYKGEEKLITAKSKEE